MIPPPPALDFSILAPLGFVAAGAFLVLLGDGWLSRGAGPVLPWLVMICTAALGLALFTAVTAFAFGVSAPFNATHAMLRADAFSSGLSVVIGVVALLSVWLSMSHLAALRIEDGECYALLMLSVCGMLVSVLAIDMMTLFVGMELMSLPLYALAALDGRNARSGEAGLKFLVLGGLASAIALYGMALLYGATGVTSFEGVRSRFDPGSELALLGLGLVTAAFAMRFAAAPFHQWAPDVEEGAPTGVSAFLSVGVRVASVAAFLRFMALSLPVIGEELRLGVLALATASVGVGSLMALIQTRVKRLLAYAGVAQVGFVLIGVAVGTPNAWVAALFSLVAYALASLGALGLVGALAWGGRERESLDDLAGLGRTRPLLAGGMTLFVLSLAAFPGTAGFVGRFALLESAVNAGFVGLAGVSSIGGVVLLAAYLRLPVSFYLRRTTAAAPEPLDTFAGLALCVCVLGLLWLGWFPESGGAGLLAMLRPAVAALTP